jgi:hypothetical protein
MAAAAAPLQYMSIEKLVESQNRDGGWPYSHGNSWTEPTVYAVLALLEAGEVEHARTGIRWILAHERKGGGWPPAPGIEESCWTAALVALIPREQLGEAAHGRAIQWLLGTMGREFTRLQRLRDWLLGQPAPPDVQSPGWPWVPGSASWVAPTSIALLALSRENGRRPSAEVAGRIEQGRRFLIDRMCVEGGWNHGAARPLGYEAEPYPETTGMALAALRGVADPKVEYSLAAGTRFLADCRSAEGINWLRLGLAAHDRLPAGYTPPGGVRYRSVPERSLALLAEAAEQGRSAFWT